MSISAFQRRKKLQQLFGIFSLQSFEGIPCSIHHSPHNFSGYFHRPNSSLSSVSYSEGLGCGSKEGRKKLFYHCLLFGQKVYKMELRVFLPGVNMYERRLGFTERLKPTTNELSRTDDN